MTWTFNPPPGWPAQPEGWQPPPGWAPDPSWPPPPAGWQFWVPVEDSPAGSHSAAVPPDGPVRRPWQQRGSVAAGVALAVLLVGCLGGAAVAVLTGQDETSVAPPTGATASPGPQPTTAPSPAPSGAGLSAGQERTGEGPAIVELYLPEGAVRTLTITFTGTEEHQMSYVDEDGEVVEFIGSGSGDYAGTHLVGEGFSVVETPAALDIAEAEGGSWTVRMQDIAEAPVWPQVSSGTGSAVLQVDPSAVAEPVTVTGTHEGESNFIVSGLSVEEFGDRTLFNEIGPFSGPAQEELGADVTIMEIMADGAWTVKPG